MDVNVVYNTPYEMPLGYWIATYFYLTGLSAGSFVISVLSTLGGKTEFKPIGRIGALMAPILLVLAPSTLIVDLEQPLRFWHLFLYLNPKSPITYGSFLLTAYPINGIIYAYYLFTGRDKLAKRLGIIGIPLAIATHGYTGFILALGKGRALWSTALMPTLFIVSAMVSGFAMMIVLAAIRNKYFYGKMTSEQREADKTLICQLGTYLAFAILFDLFLVFNDILVLLTSTEEALRVAKLILFGDFSLEFVFVELIIGGLVPLVILLSPKFNKALGNTVFASLLTLLGVYSMRVVVVIAGQSLPLH
ncbi:MAG: polysulfide reductase NrfD [Candidatus Schekmanbacteria bacterium]|nr:polysulfide reductase NrfD [Candidatus Schekmanbacteria bacterium]